MEKNEKFSLILSSDLDYEEMVVDLNFNGQPIAIANYEKGAESLEIELLALLPGQKKLGLPLDELITALQRAKEILLKCVEEDKTREKY